MFRRCAGHREDLAVEELVLFLGIALNFEVLLKRIAEVWEWHVLTICGPSWHYCSSPAVVEGFDFGIGERAVVELDFVDYAAERLVAGCGVLDVADSEAGLRAGVKVCDGPDTGRNRIRQSSVLIDPHDAGICVENSDYVYELVERAWETDDQAVVVVPSCR